MTYDIISRDHDKYNFISRDSIYFEMIGDNTCSYPSLHLQIRYETPEKPSLLVKKVKDFGFLPFRVFNKENPHIDYNLFEIQLMSLLEANPYGVELRNRDVFYTEEYKDAFSSLPPYKVEPQNVNKRLFAKFEEVLSRNIN